MQRNLPVNGLPRPPETAWRWLISIGLPLLLTAAAWLLVWADPIGLGGLVPCLFHRWTGLYCIGCGTTRALAALLQGRLAAALSYNAFAVVWLAWPAWSLAGIWLQAVFGRRVLPQPNEKRWLLILLLASALLFAIGRNMPWMPLAWLAP